MQSLRLLFLALWSFVNLNRQSEDSILAAFMSRTGTLLINKGTMIPLQSRIVAATNNAVSSGARVHRGHSAP